MSPFKSTYLYIKFIENIYFRIITVNKILSLLSMMYFIIIHSGNFEYFFSVKQMLYKGKNKVCCIVLCSCELKNLK